MKKLLFIAIVLIANYACAQIKLSGVVKDSIGNGLEITDNLI